MACLVLEQMVLICEISANLTGFVKFMKFVELATGNMLAVTNVAVCVNLALIVRVSGHGGFIFFQRSADLCVLD